MSVETTVRSYADLAAEVLRRPPRLGRTRLVCVDGPTGAGKTVVAGRLAAAFPAPVPVVHTDDLLAGWDDQLTFWPRLERLVLAPLRAGLPGCYRAYDWHRGAFGDAENEVPPAPVVIVEGVSAARASARAEATLTVLVVAPPELRLARSLARDGSAAQPYLEIWRRREERHFAADATAAHVDLVIDGGTGRDDAVTYRRLPVSASSGPWTRAADWGTITDDGPGGATAGRRP
jgi:uridine kinase